MYMCTWTLLMASFFSISLQLDPNQMNMYLSGAHEKKRTYVSFHGLLILYNNNNNTMNTVTNECTKSANPRCLHGHCPENCS